MWSQFDRVNKQIAKCRICKKQIKCELGSTSGLHSHLKLMHKIQPLKRPVQSSEAAPEVPVSTSTPTLKKFFVSDNTLQKTIARMVAKDGFAFRKFTDSRDLRTLLASKFSTSVPTSPNTIAKWVLDYSSGIRQETICMIRDMKKGDRRFSLTIDEWTSQRNRRYMNINLHYHKKAAGFINLGLIRVFGSMPATTCVKMVEHKLDAFGVSLANDIVSISTDGATVMRKVGRLIKPHQILCLLHGIQLAVVDVLYQKHQSVQPDQSDQECDEQQEGTEQQEGVTREEVLGDDDSDEIYEDNDDNDPSAADDDFVEV